ncbi:unnamed protein product [Blepharisma stoltei]|uniref:Uncharacterized protein n=1 Tax=Blepharisma stoltei TaxID=1481888 RepID=A0AAU9JZ23_9CILI|nr:unnamed protein product [Blepharisma stoltei]
MRKKELKKKSKSKILHLAPKNESPANEDMGYNQISSSQISEGPRLDNKTTIINEPLDLLLDKDEPKYEEKKSFEWKNCESDLLSGNTEDSTEDASVEEFECKSQDENIPKSELNNSDPSDMIFFLKYKR